MSRTQQSSALNDKHNFLMTEKGGLVELAPPWKRVTAYLINYVIYYFIFYISLHFYNFQTDYESNYSQNIINPFELWIFADYETDKPIRSIFSFLFMDDNFEGGVHQPLRIFLYIILPLLIYVVFQFIQMSLTGQSVGKRLMKIKVIKKNGEKAGFFNAVLVREIFYTFITLILFTMLIIDVPPNLMDFAKNVGVYLNFIDKFLNYLYRILCIFTEFSTLFLFICIIMLFIRKSDYRTLQDFLANTIVVKIK
ncbi:RDD family protein [Snodgrassella alvi]|uniref:RDD family protein n=1 Tax=Snodgrassella alvi TaxID=1196083 RepID=UPI00351C8699